MKRRTFLQLSGMTAASALLAGCQSKNEKLIPYLIPPDEGVTPGKATYYASSCTACPAGCGIVVRVSEGRAKKIEGNPGHPVNRGRLCARGQAIVQELYHPDRVAQPLKRVGPRGSGGFQKITWAEALGLLTANLKELQRNGPDRLAMMTPQLSGSLSALVDRFMRSYGSPHHLSYELLAPDWLRRATRTSFGQPGLPYYDLAETRYLLSFGADFVESHLSPVQYGNAFGRMRQERDTVRGHFTYVGGRMSLTAASADRWMPVRPGSEGALALGMVRLILAEARYDKAALAAHNLKAELLLDHLKGFDLAKVADLAGLSKESVAEVAREFATTRPSLAMAGEGLAFQTNGRESVRAVHLLNLVTGNLNRSGGVYPAGASDGPEHSFAELPALVEKMRTGGIKLALIKGDLRHSIPPATGFQEALDKVPFIVSFSTLLDDTALHADLILPDHAALESWGDVIPRGGLRQTVYGLIQPVVTPLHDTRQFGDVLLAAASELGGAVSEVLPWKSCRELVRETAGRRLATARGGDFETLWVELLRRGGGFDTGTGPGTTYRWVAAAKLPTPDLPAFAGDEVQFPLHLQLFSSTAFHDGRGAPLPWLQQLPDPMSTVVWDSWIEINPKTAASLGISQGDLVEVTSPRSTLRLPAVLYPGIRPDLVAIPLGQGHKGAGRYAKDRGVNPLELLVLPEGSEQAWNATRVRVTRISGKGDLVTAGHPQGSYRSDLIGI
ncbi:MAG: nitrate reductase [Geobacteraceae bacterium GWC2_53_11]|nr:MAG: nitrate reductase [Geobacteraceae bacterium GWC2_53_11]